MGACMGGVCATAILALALTACSDPAKPSSSPSPTSASPSSSPSPSPSETPSPTYLPAGELPEALSLDAVRARTLDAKPFGDFAVAAGDGVWVSGVGPGAVRYDAEGRITARARIPGEVGQALGAASGTVLVPSLNPSLLFRLDAVTGEVLDRVKLPASPLIESAVGAAGDRAYVLVEPSEPRILVIEGAQIVEEIPAPEGAVAVRAGFGSLWVPTASHTLERYDVEAGSWTTIPVGPNPRFLDVGFGAVWVMNQGDGSVSRVDASTGEMEQLAMTGTRIGGGDLTVGAGAVWLRTDAEVVRIDPSTRTATHVIAPPPGSASAAAADGFLLITNHDHEAVHVVPLPLPG